MGMGVESAGRPVVMRGCGRRREPRPRATDSKSEWRWAAAGGSNFELLLRCKTSSRTAERLG